MDTNHRLRAPWMNWISVLAGLLIVLFTGAAFGRELRNQGANFRFDVPDENWMQAQRGEVFVLENMDKSILIEIIGHPNQNMTVHSAAFDIGTATGLLARSLKEVKLNGKVKEVHSNGMPGVEYYGTGSKLDLTPASQQRFYHVALLP